MSVHGHSPCLLQALGDGSEGTSKTALWEARALGRKSEG